MSSTKHETVGMDFPNPSSLAVIHDRGLGCQHHSGFVPNTSSSNHCDFLGWVHLCQGAASPAGFAWVRLKRKPMAAGVGQPKQMGWHGSQQHPRHLLEVRAVPQAVQRRKGSVPGAAS